MLKQIKIRQSCSVARQIESPEMNYIIRKWALKHNSVRYTHFLVDFPAHISIYIHTYITLVYIIIQKFGV